MKTLTLRLPDEQAAELEAIARIDEATVSEEIRDAINDRIAARRADKEFQRRLREHMDRHASVLERLAR